MTISCNTGLLNSGNRAKTMFFEDCVEFGFKPRAVALLLIQLGSYSYNSSYACITWEYFIDGSTRRILEMGHMGVITTDIFDAEGNEVYSNKTNITQYI